jgi:hypothetical protein
VIFSTYRFFKKPLENLTQAQSSFVSNKGAGWRAIKYNELSKFKSIFLLKEFFFTSPQLKITLFKAVHMQLALMCFVEELIDNNKKQLIKRCANV